MTFCKRMLMLAMAMAFLQAAGPQQAARAQGLNPIDRETTLSAVRAIRDVVKKHYYDPKFHGADLDAQYNDAVAKIRQATTLGQANAYVAGFLGSLHDSHTYYIPATQSIQADYGFEAEMIGPNCYITQVEPGSNAAEKLQVGDQVAGIDGFRVTREDFFQMNRFLHQLSLQPQTTFVLRDPDGTVRNNVVVKTKIIPRRIVDDQGGIAMEAELQNDLRRLEGMQQSMAVQFYDFPDVFVARMPTFLVDSGLVERLMDKARKKGAFVLDLRGNGGGSIDAMQHMISYFFDHDVTIDKPVTRDNKEKPLVAKTHGKSTYAGRLVILIDSESASAAEIFTRVMQLEHRGEVVGDKSSGLVMESQMFPFPSSMDFQYAAMVTRADLIMNDGKSLEGVGVTPDDLVLPTGQDLAAHRDPAMTKALALVGVNLAPDAAGKLFTHYWEKPIN